MCVNLGQPIPDKLANPPQIADSIYFYLEAYFELDTERSKSMGTERIPFSRIVNYAKHVGLSHSECNDLISIIRLVDNGMIKYYNEKEK
jgi:hypothetical protein